MGTQIGNTDGNTGDQGIVDQAQQKAGQVVEQVQDKAGQVADQARQQATTQLDTQRERVGGTLQTVADAIRQTGQQLRDQDQGAIAQYADRAADQVERFYGYLGNRDVNQIVGDVERLARREPALFLGAAFAVGLIATRFLKSSGQQAQQQNMGYSSQWDYRNDYGAQSYGGYSGRVSADANGQGYGAYSGRATSYGSTGSGAGMSGYGAGTTGYGTGATGGTGYGTGATGTTGYGAGTGDAISGYGYGTGGASGSAVSTGTDYTSDVSNAEASYGEQIIAPIDINGGALSTGETGRRSDATDQG